MKNPMEFFEHDRLLHIDMIDALRDKTTKVIYSEEDGVLFCRDGWLYEITAVSAEATRKIAALMERKSDIVAHQFKFIPDIFEVTGEKETLPCMQTSYNKETPVKIPETDRITYRRLTMEDLDFVCRTYRYGENDSRYLSDRISHGMIGAFDGKRCVGFIGEHSEGSMGILEVIPEYRRRGIATALEGMMINKKLKEGRIPYDHVVLGNDASLGLQKSLGMDKAEGIVTWLFTK